MCPLSPPSRSASIPDTSLEAKGKFEPEGFYETERFDVWIEQPTQLWGTTFMGGYRIGTGDFAVYDGEAKTNSGGEYRAGVSVPLLQGGRIDPNRVELWRSRIELEKAEPIILQKRLEATRKAANSSIRRRRRRQIPGCVSSSRYFLSFGPFGGGAKTIRASRCRSIR